jgi:hypothetical protein
MVVDEASFFIPSMQEEVRAVVEGYRAKTNPKIVVVSTPWKPMGFFMILIKTLILHLRNYHFTILLA